MRGERWKVRCLYGISMEFGRFNHESRVGGSWSSGSGISWSSHHALRDSRIVHQIEAFHFAPVTPPQYFKAVQQSRTPSSCTSDLFITNPNDPYSSFLYSDNSIFQLTLSHDSIKPNLSPIFSFQHLNSSSNSTAISLTMSESCSNQSLLSVQADSQLHLLLQTENQPKEYTLFESILWGQIHAHALHPHFIQDFCILGYPLDKTERISTELTGYSFESGDVRQVSSRTVERNTEDSRYWVEYSVSGGSVLVIDRNGVRSLDFRSSQYSNSTQSSRVSDWNLHRNDQGISCFKKFQSLGPYYYLLATDTILAIMDERHMSLPIFEWSYPYPKSPHPITHICHVPIDVKENFNSTASMIDAALITTGIEESSEVFTFCATNGPVKHHSNTLRNDIFVTSTIASLFPPFGPIPSFSQTKAHRNAPRYVPPPYSKSSKNKDLRTQSNQPLPKRNLHRLCGTCWMKLDRGDRDAMVLGQLSSNGDLILQVFEGKEAEDEAVFDRTMWILEDEKEARDSDDLNQEKNPRIEEECEWKDTKEWLNGGRKLNLEDKTFITSPWNEQLPILDSEKAKHQIELSKYNGTKKTNHVITESTLPILGIHIRNTQSPSNLSKAASSTLQKCTTRSFLSHSSWMDK
mmetsp:Transcript_13633/g.24449  ORF Transcript_13633/g.24449 Transcript_13633/m.24449 type:complete len:633 (+) Transcript_13633:89-1987(+)